MVCSKCGAKVPEGVRFCTECGTPTANGSATTATSSTADPLSTPTATAVRPPQQAAAYMQTPQPRASFDQAIPAYAVDAPPPAGSRYAVMGMGSFISHSILFAIPILGWIVCLIMAFAAKNQNKRNYARATLVFLIIGLILSLLLSFIFNMIAQTIIDSLNEASGGALGQINGLQGLLDLLKSYGSISP